MKSTATARWNGTLKGGSGQVSAQSAFFKNLPYTFVSRFVDGSGGTTPEELIAAAHAACYSMALSANLEKAGIIPESVETTSTVTLENGVITSSHLAVKAKISGITPADFERHAADTKSTCPVSKALNLNITVEARLI
jgi:lipoyl-dependent peroxiredoxin